MAKKPTKAGKIKLVVADKSERPQLPPERARREREDGRSRSRDANELTVTLKKGTYRFVCDPHASSMKGRSRFS